MANLADARSHITATVFLYDAKEELQLYGTATSNSKQDLRN